MSSSTPFIFLMGVYPFLLLGSLVLPVVCFFLSRNDEKRSGVIQYSGKSMVVFTLVNYGAWLFFVGATMVFLTFVMADEGQNAWVPLRIGLVLMIIGAVSVKVVTGLWSTWTKTGDWLPSWNMFVKCYSGLNTLVLFTGIVAASGYLLYAIFEMMFGIADWRHFKQPVKTILPVLVTSGVFLYVNLLVYGRSEDDIVPFGIKAER